MSDEALRIAVAIATRRRPEGCRRLVDAVLAQDLPKGWLLRVIVVDNGTVPGDLQLPPDPRLDVVHEPEPGIPFARNQGVDRALPWADVIVFVDDDEIPADSSWLRVLVRGLEEYRADVVSGPVRSVFTDDTPDWIRQHPVFQRRRRRSGDQLAETYTGNTAVMAELFRNGRRFDPEFRRTGGSDTEFFRAAKRGGAVISWVEEAAVEETVPAERANPRWILARSFRIGANRVQFLRAAPGTPAWNWISLVAGSLLELALGLGAPLLLVLSRRRGLAILGRAARGLGTLAALVGFRYDAYR